MEKHEQLKILSLKNRSMEFLYYHCPRLLFLPDISLVFRLTLQHSSLTTRECRRCLRCIGAALLRLAESCGVGSWQNAARRPEEKHSSTAFLFRQISAIFLSHHSHANSVQCMGIAAGFTFVLCSCVTRAPK